MIDYRKQINLLEKCLSKDFEEPKELTLVQKIKNKTKTTLAYFDKDVVKIILVTVTLGYIGGSAIVLVQHQFDKFAYLTKENNSLKQSFNFVENEWREQRDEINLLKKEITIDQQIIELNPADKAVFDDCIANPKIAQSSSQFKKISCLNELP